jgi:hypothetical protein
MNRGLSVALLVAVAACGVDARRRAELVAPEPMPTPADTILAPYASVAEGAWLGGRRWVIVSPEFEAVRVLDFSNRTMNPVGGPKNAELKKPFGVFAVGDTAFVRDWGLGRVTLWIGGTTLNGAIAAPAGTRGILPRARDAAGQYYFELPPIPGPDGSGNRDSISVVRSDPAFTKFDTIARLTPIEIQEVQRNSGQRFERLVFSGNDWWGVLPDGRLWISRVHQSRVNLVTNRHERRGEELPDPVYEVTRVDREQFIQGFPPEVRGTVEDLPFATIKPPFERALAGPDGMIWLRKSRPAADSIRRYQLVDTTGRLARVLTTKGNGLMLAVGREAVLIAEQYKNGVRLLEARIPH